MQSYTQQNAEGGRVMRTFWRSLPFACIILSRRLACLKAATESFREGPIFAQEALNFRNPLMERGKGSPAIQNPHFTKIGRLSRRQSREKAN